MKRRQLSVGLVSPLPPQVGGVAGVAQWLLANQRTIGCSYVTFDLARPPGGEVGGRFRFAAVPRQAFLIARFLRWLLDAPRILHIAVSDSFTGLSRDVLLVIAGRVARRRVIAHFHSLSYGTLKGATFFHVPAARLVGRLAHRSVSLAPTAAAELARLGISTTWIFNPIPFSPKPVGARGPERAHDKAALRLLYVGAFGAQKGSPELVEAIARARSRGVDARLRIVGGEMYRGDADALARQIRLSGLGAIVDFEGVKPWHDVASYYDSADAICLPSHREGLPLSLLEGMAAGLPALATAVGCIPDVVISGETGILVKLGDVDALACAIESLANDELSRRRMGAAARRRVLSLAAPDAIAAAWRNLYSELA